MNSVTAVKQQMLQTLMAALGASDAAPIAGKVPAGIPPVAATQALDLPALVGQVIDGHVTQMKADGQALLQTKAGPIALVLPEAGSKAGQSAALSTGQMVKLDITGLMPDGRLAARLVATSGAAAPAVVAADRLAPNLAQAMQAQATITPAIAKAVAAPLAAAALPRQAGLAPLFANLAAVVSSPVAQVQLPRGLVAAVQQIMSARLPLDQAGEPQRLREAVRQSGLFHEAFAQSGQPAAAPDLKAQLQTLRALLAQFAVPGAEGQPATDAPTEQAPALPKAVGEPVKGSTVLVPPRAQGTLQPQASMPATLDPNEANATLIIRTLSAQVDGVLDRQTLLQVASLPPTVAEMRQEGGQVQRWLVELPVAAQGQTQVMPLEIEEDRREASSGEADQRIWRVKFALDDATLGPIHGAVTLVNRRVAVTFWAEREVTRAALRAGRDALNATLTATRFAEAEIEVLAGAPPRPRAERAGTFLDQRA